MTRSIAEKRRRGILTALLTVAAPALAACAGLPTSGPVNPGLPAGADAGEPDFAFRPDSPQPGATPEQIVDGFIRAGSGPADNWAIARKYLAPPIAGEWNPNAGVTIDIGGERTPESPAEDAVRMTVTAVASTDETGLYAQVAPGPTTLPFRLARQDDGEWRITEAPDGIVLDRDQFPRVFDRFALSFFDATGAFLVPDVRWFPRTNAATHIAAALIDGGPSPWLTGSVITAFPDEVSLARPSVPVVDGVAVVDLDESARAVAPDTLSRMQAQLDASLATAGVTRVEMTVATTPLDVEAAQTRSTRVATLPLVITGDGEFGFAAGDEITPVPGLSDTMKTVSPVAVQLAPDADFAGVRLTDGAVARVDASGGVVVHDERPGLIDPTVDPFGYVWSVPSGQPAALAAFSATGERIDIAGALPDVDVVSAIAISRDGARLAAVVTSGGRPAVWIAGIVRDLEGVPSRLADQPLVLTQLPGAGAGIAWLDDVTVGVLAHVGEDDAAVVEVPVGGPSSATSAPDGAVQIAGANQSSTVRLRGADGALYVKRGSNWTQTSIGLLVLATQQGLPR